MRLYAKLHTLAIVMVLFTFSAPFVTLGQRNSAQEEANGAANNGANAIGLEAKVNAERDANSDINKLIWFGVGAGTCIIGSTVGGIGGCAIGSILSPEPEDFFSYAVPNDTQMITTLVGCLVGGISPLIGIYNYQQNPPSHRLLGKSPEYVEFYTKTYKAKTRSIRTNSAVAGIATGCVLFTVYTFWSVTQ